MSLYLTLFLFHMSIHSLRYARSNSSSFRLRTPSRISKVEAVCVCQRAVRRYLQKKTKKRRQSILECVSKTQQNKMILKLQLRMKMLEFENQDLRNRLLEYKFSSSSSSSPSSSKNLSDGLIDIARLTAECATGGGLNGM